MFERQTELLLNLFNGQLQLKERVLKIETTRRVLIILIYYINFCHQFHSTKSITWEPFFYLIMQLHLLHQQSNAL